MKCADFLEPHFFAEPLEVLLPHLSIPFQSRGPLMALDPRKIDTKNLGKRLTPEKARKHPRLDDFFAVSDFIIDNDPAVLSYLSGEEVNIAGRVCKH